MFVHGWASDRSFWRPQMEGPNLGRRLVAVDLIGHGESDKPEVTYTMDLFARSVAAVLDELGIERAVLVGHSNGVPVVRQFYRMYPARTEALVVVDGPLRQVTPTPWQKQMMEQLRGPNYKQVLEMMVEQMPAGTLAEEELAHVKEVTLGTPQHVLVGGLEAALNPTIWEEDTIGVPLLVVLAKNPYSPLLKDNYEVFVQKIAPRAEYHLWEGVSHLLTMERPTEFNDLLKAFVARVQAGEI